MTPIRDDIRDERRDWPAQHLGHHIGPAPRSHELGITTPHLTQDNVAIIPEKGLDNKRPKKYTYQDYVDETLADLEHDQ